ncbi:PASTA domain-containing protein [bacterium]|nr:PASTA domain-containing protein [bacterium]
MFKSIFNKRYVASFAGFFPADVPKYSCIVVIHDPNKKKGYYGATVAAPVFKEIAQKIYTSTPIKDDIVKENFSSEIIQNLYTSFNKEITENNDIIPNVTGMPAMDAISLLENFGLIVEVKGIGKVKKQSLKKGTPIKKGATIILNLS